MILYPLPSLEIPQELGGLDLINSTIFSIEILEFIITNPYLVLRGY